MKKIDLLKLRKAVGLSQKELADRLAVQPSFISAIENGRSRFPEEKIDRLKEAVAIDNIDPYLVEESTVTPIPPHTHAFEEGDSISKLLRHFHALAHKNDDSDKEKEKELLARIEYLSKRNDRLSDRLDELRDTVDKLREENYLLKELLIKNRIEF